MPQIRPPLALGTTVAEAHGNSLVTPFGTPDGDPDPKLAAADATTGVFFV